MQRIDKTLRPLFADQVYSYMHTDMGMLKRDKMTSRLGVLHDATCWEKGVECGEIDI